MGDAAVQGAMDGGQTNRAACLKFHDLAISFGRFIQFRNARRKSIAARFSRRSSSACLLVALRTRLLPGLNGPALWSTSNIYRHRHFSKAYQAVTAGDRAARRALASRGRSTRFHHMIAPVTNIAAGASPNTAQIAFVVWSQNPGPLQGIPMPLTRPKCKKASQ